MNLAPRLSSASTVAEPKAVQPTASLPGLAGSTVVTTTRRNTVLAAAAILMSIVLLGGCSGSGAGSGGGGGPTTPQPFVTVVSDDGDTPSVTMVRGAATQGANLSLEIQANELQNVQTLDFVLNFPGSLMRATAITRGDFLGFDAVLITTALDANRLQVLMTRATAGGTGSGTVITVQFEALGPGTGRLEFIDPEAGTVAGLPIAGIAWLGADVEVSP